MKVLGNDVGQTQEQTFTFRWTPAGKDGDGWRLGQKIEGVKMDVEVGGAKTTFDSTRLRAPGGALSEFCKALLGAEFQVTLDGGYRVRKVKGRRAFLRKCAASLPALGKLAGRLLDEEALVLSAETLFAVLPGKPVRPGDSWSVKRRLDLGSVGECQATYRYTWKGREGRLDKLAISVEGVRGIQPPGKDGGSPFKVEKGEPNRVEGAGVLLFDRRKGRVASMETSVKVEGEATGAVGGRQVRAKFELEQQLTVKTTDVNPLQPMLLQEDKDREIRRLREENQRLRKRLRAVEEAIRPAKKPGD
jgi:hypothetical protein